METEVLIPYGRQTLKIAFPDKKLAGVYEPQCSPPAGEPIELLREALRHPIGASPLRERAAGARRVAIAIDDATRPVPSALLIEAVMEELGGAGIGEDRVTVVVATGLHRGMSPEEIATALGKWHGRLRVENHDAASPAGLTRLGTTSLGAEIHLNRTFLEADLKILTGDVEYHQFCGYGGGAKSVYPGLADASAIKMNHSRMGLPGAGLGKVEGNPIRREIEEVGRMAGADYLLTVVLDPGHRILAAYCGDVGLAFGAARQKVDAVYRLTVPRRVDLAVVSPGGHPRDIDLYQSQKAITEGLRIVRPGGNILLVAACAEGSGSALFETWMEQAFTPDDVSRRLEQSFVMGGHKAHQIAQSVKLAGVHIHSELPPGKVRAWFMRPVRGQSEIRELIDAAESIAVLPQATLTLIEAGEPTPPTGAGG